MKKGIIGKKLGMTQIFDERGNVIQIVCKMESAYTGDIAIDGGLVIAYQRFALIRMDKQDVENIVFKLKNNPL